MHQKVNRSGIACHMFENGESCVPYTKGPIAPKDHKLFSIAQSKTLNVGKDLIRSLAQLRSLIALHESRAFDKVSFAIDVNF